MPTFILTNNPLFKDPITLSKTDEHHLIKVMRIKKGEMISLTNNQGSLAQAKVLNTKPLEFKIIDIKKTASPCTITLHLPLIDTDRLEWAIQKLTELNIKTVQLTITERTQKKDISDQKLKRLHKIATEAQKQSNRTWPLEILSPQPLSNLHFDPTHTHILGTMDDKQTNTQEHKQRATSNEQQTNIYIGPEGGFTDHEIQLFEKHNATKINLGDTTLRTETAAIVLAGILKQ